MSYDINEVMSFDMNLIGPVRIGPDAENYQAIGTARALRSSLLGAGRAFHENRSNRTSYRERAT